MASYPTPKIVYGATALTFTLPPTQKPDGLGRPVSLKGQRNDSFSISGLQQTLWWRTDRFLKLQMPDVPQADLPAWEDFFDYAIPGGEFSYYPDATKAGFTVYQLSDTDWEPTFAYRGSSKFNMVFRKVVGADQTGS